MTIDSYGVNGRERVWIGVDPGITTGWCLLTDEGKVLGRGVFVEENLKDGLDQLVRGVHRSARKIEVVVEQMPGAGRMGDLNRRLERVRGVVDEVLVEVYDLPVTYIPPGEWKTSRVAQLASPPGDTQHEKDAIVMTAYAIAKRRRHNAN